MRRRTLIQIDGDDTEGHVRSLRMDMTGQAVTVRADETGDEAGGHLFTIDEGGETGSEAPVRWGVEVDDDDTVGHPGKWHLDMTGQAITVRLEESGEEVHGHVLPAAGDPTDDVEGHRRA